MSFKHTAQINDAFGFYGIGDRNFLGNSGSYFAIQLYVLTYYLALMFINFLAARFPQYEYARLAGRWAYSPHYARDVLQATQKLFLEACFDLSMCCFISLSAFCVSEDFDDFAEFWQTRDDILASVCTIAALFCIFLFIIYGYVNIKKNQGNLDDAEVESQLRVFTDGCHTDSFHSSMYNVYFLSRRVFTSFVLVAAEKYPYFQSSSLLAISTLNLVYTLAEKPLICTLTNRIEAFNEACVLLCCYTSFMQCNKALNKAAQAWLGWVFIYAAGFNIFVNLVVTCYNSVIGLHRRFVDYLDERRVRKIFSDQYDNRKYIVE